ncbi:hypothetical protein VKT23_004708 [Stygiomarasmius scandens]|uniref:Uncharacterized protein n=1 Tax=Marasmiellus scandens TaxID=2682957 RepID=A0ABR1JVP3_9AGAR
MFYLASVLSLPILNLILHSFTQPLELKTLTKTMNSPDGSPISTPSSVTPPPEEAGASYAATSGNTSHLLNVVTSNLSSGGATASPSQSSGKRRLPGGGSFTSGSARDPKTRRRDDREPRKGMSGNGPWEKEGKKSKDEDLIDSQIVEQLRKDIGDPFLDPSFD